MSLKRKTPVTEDGDVKEKKLKSTKKKMNGDGKYPDSKGKMRRKTSVTEDAGDVQEKKVKSTKKKDKMLMEDAEDGDVQEKKVRSTKKKAKDKMLTEDSEDGDVQEKKVKSTKKKVKDQMLMEDAEDGDVQEKKVKSTKKKVQDTMLMEDGDVQEKKVKSTKKKAKDKMLTEDAEDEMLTEDADDEMLTEDADDEMLTEDAADGDVQEKKMKSTKKKVAGDGKNPDCKEKKLAKDTAATRKERKLSRKMQKPNYELSRETLQMWEKLRINKAKLSQKEREELVKELMNAVKKQGKTLVSLTYAHDTSRVLQSCLKQGTPQQREEIYNDLKGEVVNLSKNRYSKNLVWKLLKYGTPKQRDELIHQFAGVVPKMIRKQAPASIIEYAYNTYANKEQRSFLVNQLYGNSFNISKSAENATLEDVLKEQPEKRGVILANFKQSLMPLIDKQVISHTIVHRVFNEFFTSCDSEEQLRSELIELLRESVVHMMHTRDGAHVAMHCLWHGTTKDRKVIIKTMKEFISKLCQEEYGHLVLLAAFDCVDDTVFVTKTLITSIVKILPEIIENKYARKVLLYLVSPRNKSHFLPETVAFLSKGDNNKHSKKPMEARHKELSQAVSPGLISYLKDHLETMVKDRSQHTLVKAALSHCQADVTGLVESLLEIVSSSFEAGLEDNAGRMHIIEDPAGHLLLKHLVSEKREEGRAHFAAKLIESVEAAKICSWSSCNRGSQVLLGLLRSPEEDVSKAVKELFQENLKTLKRNKNVKSTQHLLEKLAE